MSPAIGLIVACDDASMIPASCDLFNCETRHSALQYGNRSKAVVAGSVVASLAVSIIPPAVYLIIICDNAGVILAGGDVLD